MLYTKIKIEDKWYPERLYRVVLIKGNPRLSILGSVFGRIFEASFEHYFMFRKKKETFVANSWINQFGINEDEHSISFSYLNDLGTEFEYEYDTGEGYEFKCKKYKEKIEIIRDELDEEEYPDVITIEAKGKGIFEDYHGMLEDYFEGKLSGEFNDEDEDEENFYSMPFNLYLDKLADFDNPIDLEEYEFFYDDVEYISKQFDDEIIDESVDYVDDSRYTIEQMLREDAAFDIFNNERMNEVFRELIKSVDINDAYEMICQIYKEMEEICEEDEIDENDYERLFKEKIDSLIKH